MKVPSSAKGLEKMPAKKEILRVRADKEAIKKSYGRISRWFALVEGRIEKGLREKGLKHLDVHEGETILEIGFGTGFTLVEIAKSVGETGKAYGIDATPEMVKLCKERLERKGLAERVELSEGDARDMPYENNMFDAVYMACTLELFDTPDILKILKECKKVLKPDGRLGIVSMCREGYENTKFIKAYEWVHRTFPRYASCRPIYVEASLRDAGYRIIKMDEVMLAGLCPMKIVVAKL